MKPFVLVVLPFLAFGCSKKKVAEAPALPSVSAAAPTKTAPKKATPDKAGSFQMDQVEPHLGEPSVQPGLPFRIVKVYEKQKPSSAAPWHQPGGDWIFFDARIADVGPALFTFGLREVTPKGPLPMAFSDAILATPDRMSAARLLAGLSFALHVKEPTPRPERPVAPLHMRAVILGRNQARDSGGSFADGGSWTATKLFLTQGKRYGEIFLNFDPTSLRGELSEKDSDYDADVVAVLASLRDGA